MFQEVWLALFEKAMGRSLRVRHVPRAALSVGRRALARTKPEIASLTRGARRDLEPFRRRRGHFLFYDQDMQPVPGDSQVDSQALWIADYDPWPDRIPRALRGTDLVRDSDQVSGMVNPLSRRIAGRYDLTVGSCSEGVGRRGVAVAGCQRCRPVRERAADRGAGRR